MRDFSRGWSGHTSVRDLFLTFYIWLIPFPQLSTLYRGVWNLFRGQWDFCLRGEWLSVKVTRHQVHYSSSPNPFGFLFELLNGICNLNYFLQLHLPQSLSKIKFGKYQIPDLSNGSPGRLPLRITCTDPPSKYFLCCVGLIFHLLRN